MLQTIPYTIHPILSTGTKLWHLRRDGIFYPKVNFYNALRCIPDGAIVVFNFGEIDCRESLQKCVDDCKYEVCKGTSTLLDLLSVVCLYDYQRFSIPWLSISVQLVSVHCTKVVSTHVHTATILALFSGTACTIGVNPTRPSGLFRPLSQSSSVEPSPHRLTLRDVAS